MMGVVDMGVVDMGIGGVSGGGGPVQIACSGVKLNDVQPSSSPWWSIRDPINQPFIS